MNPSGQTTRMFRTELASLEAFVEVLNDEQADLLVGYNVCGFDWKYVLQRVQMNERAGAIL